MKKFIILLVLLVSSTGCAVTTDRIVLNYTPQTNPDKVKGAEVVKLKVSTRDNRAIKNCVSRKRNGYGQEMAPIIADNSIPDLLTQTITSELKNRGFNCSGEKTNVILDLQKYYCDFTDHRRLQEGHAYSDLAFNVIVTDRYGAMIFFKPVSESDVELSFACLGDDAKVALENTLKTCVSNLMDDKGFIKALLATGDFK